MSLLLADLKLVTRGHAAVRGSSERDLKGREFHLLEHLLDLLREMAVHDVWGRAVRYTSLDNVIDAHIPRIQRKVDCRFPQKLLHTLHRIGYVVSAGREA